ncbi:MAG: aldehyde dehydrogenase family protein [Candidatus Aminicenantales bacterium]
MRKRAKRQLKNRAGNLLAVGSLSRDLSRLFPHEDDIPARFRLNSRLDQDRILINGEIVPWKGPVGEVFSPIFVRKSNVFIEKRIGSHPEMTGKDALQALDAARRAFSPGNGRWPSLPLSSRIQCTERFLESLGSLKKTIVTTLMWEIAKPYGELEDEFERTVDYINQVVKVASINEKKSRVLRREKGIMGIIYDEPYGVVLCMGPYNYPLFETFSLVFPALLAGNTVIIKPPKFGVLFFNLLLEGFRDCFPPGVVNIISGDGKTIVEPLMKSGGIDVFAFIGSRPTANRLMGLHPRKNRLRSLLGLGAKNPVIVLPDADLETAVRESVLGALAFNGQRCAALKIFFVHQDVEEPFRRSLSRHIAETRIGMPWTEGVRITPLADPDRISYLHELVEDALDQGSLIGNKNGGKSFHSLFIPTLLSPVRAKMKVYWEEQFGPIIPLVPYDTMEVPISHIIHSPFGQQVSIFGTRIESLARLVNSIKNQVARININSKCQRGPDLFPFTGRKDSAKGDFSTPEIMNVFSAKTVVAARENELSESFFRSLRRLRTREHKQGSQMSPLPGKPVHE